MHLLLHHARVGQVLLVAPRLLLLLLVVRRLRGPLLVVAVDDDAVDPGGNLRHALRLPPAARTLHVHALRTQLMRSVHLVHHLLLGDVPARSGVIDRLGEVGPVRARSPPRGFPSRLCALSLLLLRGATDVAAGGLAGCAPLTRDLRGLEDALRLGGGGRLDVERLSRAAVGPATSATHPTARRRLERLPRPRGGGGARRDGRGDGELRGFDGRVVGVRPRLAERDERLLHRRIGVPENPVAACIGGHVRGALSRVRDRARLFGGGGGGDDDDGFVGVGRARAVVGGRVALDAPLALDDHDAVVAAGRFRRGRRVQVRIPRRRPGRGDGGEPRPFRRRLARCVRVGAVLPLDAGKRRRSLAEDLGDLRLDVVGGRGERRGNDGVIHLDVVVGVLLERIRRGRVHSCIRRDGVWGDVDDGNDGADRSALDGPHRAATREPEPARVAQRADAVGPASHERRGVAGAPAV
mmetsp:Transcript_7724/g.34029  ORF Transcript_7724/g.34029 Transcript_7724/m.34029 type:complete len:467 (+) Transcript_7724:1251-2651(+)